MGRCGESKDQLEGTVVNGSKQNLFYHQSNVCHASITRKSPSVARNHPIMTGCKNCLTQGRYTWRHSKVMSIPPLKATAFTREGQKTPEHWSTMPETGHLCMAQDRKMLADIGHKLIFPPEIASTNLGPSLVLWSPSLKAVVPWKILVEEVYECRSYSEVMCAPSFTVLHVQSKLASSS